MNNKDITQNTEGGEVYVNQVLSKGKKLLFLNRQPPCYYIVKSRKSLVSDRVTWTTRTSHKTLRGRGVCESDALEG